YSYAQANTLDFNVVLSSPSPGVKAIVRGKRTTSLIAFTPGLGDDSTTLKSKVFAWAYELSADIRLGKVSDDLMELLRYDTMFTCHRQDVFNSLANKVLLKDY
ncbi:hypothetical protein ACUODJ_44790, partial [Escherichia sp. HC-CC]